MGLREWRRVMRFHRILFTSILKEKLFGKNEIQTTDVLMTLIDADAYRDLHVFVVVGVLSNN